MGHSRFPQGLHATPFLTMRTRVARGPVARSSVEPKMATSVPRASCPCSSMAGTAMAHCRAVREPPLRKHASRGGDGVTGMGGWGQTPRFLFIFRRPDRSRVLTLNAGWLRLLIFGVGTGRLPVSAAEIENDQRCARPDRFDG